MAGGELEGLSGGLKHALYIDVRASCSSFRSVMLAQLLESVSSTEYHIYLGRGQLNRRVRMVGIAKLQVEIRTSLDFQDI